MGPASLPDCVVLSVRLSALVLATTLILAASGCGGGGHGTAPRRPASAPNATGGSRGPALGLTENDADLLWSPGAPAPVPGVFLAAREELAALHPAYLRLLVDWAALQPRPGRPPGCRRPRPPR